MSTIKVGCCGFPISYKQYMKKLKVVEVQQSFYRQLTDKQIKNWLKAAPEDFEFVLKAPQCVTHPPNSPTYRRSHLDKSERKDCGFFKLTDIVKREMETFLKRAEKLKAKVILFQTPASFKPTEENLENLHRYFDYYKDEKFIFFWEPRGSEWSLELVRSLCQNLKIYHATDPFLELPPAQDNPIYFRMHGDLKTYNYSYSDDELLKLAQMAKGKTGYVFFNNSNMLEDALKFLSYLKNRSTS
ncbi:conserved hypothetical protein [Thermosulfidibacter takaii ABI70S6]|uniref:DUF72 domain-containing protein n=1 Tax=Thermosulfidibacter takaii (strain DSM 17441 / JCM 13301 / NBRC 103674 / ABI70S6) TaxID=1298851 RepID=A0A0S3QSI9_THET7|nr:DUF72 domain-containing protein [Thermosulfidibacter takaii]BAT71304.1 conserved hypothetical protein [Thermosulfidibacter takaii ABI70S6]